VRGGTGRTIGTSVKNTGTGPITITSLNITAPTRASSAWTRRNRCRSRSRRRIAAAQDRVHTPAGHALNDQDATLTIRRDGKTKTVSLRGLPTAGTGGENEPSLQRVLDLYEIPLNVGDANPSDVFIGDPPTTA
jgi:hypothetical protein